MKEKLVSLINIDLLEGVENLLSLGRKNNIDNIEQKYNIKNYILSRFLSDDK